MKDAVRIFKAEDFMVLDQVDAIDIQTLLLRLGIRSSVYEAQYEGTEGGKTVTRTAYQVTPRGTRRFATSLSSASSSSVSAQRCGPTR